MRSKMSRANRAKQFMPFAALKGYDRALRQKETVPAAKIELGEDAREELNRAFGQVRPNQLLTAVYFDGETYRELTGVVSRIDLDAKILRIVKTQIPIDRVIALRFPEGDA